MKKSIFDSPKQFLEFQGAFKKMLDEKADRGKLYWENVAEAKTGDVVCVRCGQVISRDYESDRGCPETELYTHYCGLPLPEEQGTIQ